MIIVLSLCPFKSRSDKGFLLCPFLLQYVLLVSLNPELSFVISPTCNFLSHAVSVCYLFAAGTLPVPAKYYYPYYVGEKLWPNSVELRLSVCKPQTLF